MLIEYYFFLSNAQIQAKVIKNSHFDLQYDLTTLYS